MLKWKMQYKKAVNAKYYLFAFTAFYLQLLVISEATRAGSLVASSPGVIGRGVASRVVDHPGESKNNSYDHHSEDETNED